MKVNFKAFTLLSIVISTLLNIPGQAKGSPADKKSGNLYMQTNGIINEIVNYSRMGNGNLVEVQRIATGGAGSGTFKPITGHDGEPNAFEGVKSIILSALLGSYYS